MMKRITIIFFAFMLVSAAKCQGLKECPKTAAEWHALKIATLGNSNREEGLKNFKRLVTTTKIANCIRPDHPDGQPLLHEFGTKLTRAAGNANVGEWDNAYEQMVRHLFKLGVDVEARSNRVSRFKAMHSACHGDANGFIDLLLELGVDPNSETIAVSGTRLPALLTCAEFSNAYGVAKLLDTGKITDKKIICRAYWASSFDPVIIAFEDRGWDLESCPAGGHY